MSRPLNYSAIVGGEPLGGPSPEFDALIKQRTPLGRWGRAEEIASVAVFLASPAASYVNGHVLTADGGLTVAL